jgi:hypothetical protein
MYGALLQFAHTLSGKNVDFITQSCSVYISVHTAMNTTILQLVAIYKIQLPVSALYAGHHRVVQRT